MNIQTKEKIKTPIKTANKIPFHPKLKSVRYDQILTLLQRVERPGRYVGGEFGLAEKDLEKSSVRVLLSYPDTYELGMSNEGLRILYDCVNRDDRFFADRTYLPWPDFKKEMQKVNIPLYSLDKFLEASSFDFWGFNTSHELHYTNLCYALDLAQIPVFRKNRRAHDPIIVTGGTAVSNPFPLFDFMDGIFLGDGEEAIVEICEIIAIGKEQGQSREEIIFNLQNIEGLLLPSLYETEDLGYSSYPIYKGPLIKKRNYKTTSFSALKHILVPNIDIVQDRVVLEVARGCGQGCRFCHAGFWKRPVRNSEVATLIKTAGEMLKKTGHNSISLHSLSIADYPWLEELVVGMAQEYGENGVSLSLPSLRVQVKTIPVLEMTSKIRRSNITFALEAGSELQRERIRKKSSEENLHYLIREVYSRGWDLVKVYFMLGLPDKEGNEITSLIQSINALGKLAEENGPRKRVNITVSLFVPKPFTTFQWEKQKEPEYFHKALKKLRSNVTSKRINLKGPSPEMPYVEGLLSRSDHRIGKWIWEAYQKGASFDSWDDQFSPSLWKEIIASLPIELRELWLEKKCLNEPLPWQNLIQSVKADLLRKDYQRYENINTENMNPPHPQALKKTDFPPELLKPISIPEKKYNTKCILSVYYTRQEKLIYTSHLETIEILRKAFRRSQMPMTFSQGFNKKEKLHYYSNLATYIHSEYECIYVELYDSIQIEELTQKLQKTLPKGMLIVHLETLDTLPKATSILEKKLRYRLSFQNLELAKKSFELLKKAPATFKYEKASGAKKKRKFVEKSLGDAISFLNWEERQNSPKMEYFIIVEISHSNSGALSIKDLVIYFLGIPIERWNIDLRITHLSSSY